MTLVFACGLRSVLRIHNVCNSDTLQWRVSFILQNNGSSGWGGPHNVFEMTIGAVWVSLENDIFALESQSRVSVTNCTHRKSGIVIDQFSARSLLQHRLSKCRKSRPSWCGKWHAALVLRATTVFQSRCCAGQPHTLGDDVIIRKEGYGGMDPWSHFHPHEHMWEVKL